MANEAKVKHNFLYRWNKKYDGMKEPLRFLLFFGLVIPGIIAAGTPNIAVAIGGMIYLLLVCFTRVLYLSGVWIK